MAIKGTREDTFRVTLTIDGADWGVWDRKTGGKLNANSVKYKPGGMEPEISLGGTPTADNLVLSRNYRLQRDHDRLHTLLARVGKARCVAKQLPLDPDANAYGHPVVFSGTLDAVAPPDHDSTSTNPAMLELEIALDGPVTA